MSVSARMYSLHRIHTQRGRIRPVQSDSTSWRPERTARRWQSLAADTTETSSTVPLHIPAGANASTKTKRCGSVSGGRSQIEGRIRLIEEAKATRPGKHSFEPSSKVRHLPSVRVESPKKPKYRKLEMSGNGKGGTAQVISTASNSAPTSLSKGQGDAMHDNPSLVADTWASASTELELLTMSTWSDVLCPPLSRLLDAPVAEAESLDGHDNSRVTCAIIADRSREGGKNAVAMSDVGKIRLYDLQQWKNRFPQGTLRDAVDPPIRAILACIGAGRSSRMFLINKIVDDLSDIAQRSESASRVIKVNSVWRRTFDLVLEHAKMLEKRTSTLNSAIASASSEKAKETAMQRVDTHRTAMRRIREFFLAYHGATGEHRMWQDTWRRISGETQDAQETTALPAPDSSFLSDGIIDNSEESSPTRTAAIPGEGEKTSSRGDGAVPVLTRTQRRKIKRLIKELDEFRRLDMGFSREYITQLELLRYQQGSLDPMVIATLLQDLVHHNQDLIKEHTQSMLKFSTGDRKTADPVSNDSGSMEQNPGRLLLQAFGRLNERIDAYSQALTAGASSKLKPSTEAAVIQNANDIASDKERRAISESTSRGIPWNDAESKLINLASWKTVQMSKEHSKEMGRLIPVYLAYLAVGIEDSGQYSTASRILWDCHNVKTKDEKDAKMRELVAVSIEFSSGKQSVLQKEMSRVETLLKQAKSKKESLPLSKRISRLKNAISLTARLRSKYLAPTSDAQQDSAPSLRDLASAGQLSSGSKIERGLTSRTKSDIELKPNRPAVFESPEDWSKARISSVDSMAVLENVDFESTKLKHNPEKSIGCGAKTGSKADRDLSLFKHALAHSAISKHKSRRPAPIATNLPGPLQSIGNSASSVAQGEPPALREASAEEGVASHEVPQIGPSHTYHTRISHGGNLDPAVRKPSTVDAVIFKAQQALSKFLTIANLGKRHMPETEELSAKKSHLPTFIDETTQKMTHESLSRRLRSWFERDQAKETLIPPAASRNIVVAGATSSASFTDWESIGYLNFGHWLAARMETLHEREAAHVLRLLPSSDQVVLDRQDILGQWRDEIRKSFGNLSSYNGEINDKRIQVHLDEIISTDDDISISSIGKWQMLEARRLQKKLKQDTSVLEVFTTGSFGIDTMGRLHGLGEVVVESVRPIRDLCEIGPHVGSSSEADLAALLRSLQMVRDAFAERGDSREFRQYRRLIFATGSIMSLRAVSGAGAHGQSERELKRSTRIAALCRMHAAEILNRQQDIDSVHFIWLPLNARAMARKS